MGFSRQEYWSGLPFPSPQLILREMQIKTRMCNYLTLVRMAIIKKSTNKCWRGYGEQETLLHCWQQCKLVQSLWKTVWKSLKKLKTVLPYDLSIPFLGIYLDKTVIWKDICIPVFIEAQFTIAKTWKQPKSPSTDEWIDMVCMYTHTHTHTGYYSAIRKNEIMPFCSNMDKPRNYHSKWSKSERERQIPYDITYMWNLKYDVNELIHETETDSQTYRTDFWLPRGKWGGRNGMGVWD